MGQSSGKLYNTFFGNTEIRVLMLGLDATGKTSLLNKLLVGELLPTIPTIGFNVKTVQHKNVAFTLWDCGRMWEFGLGQRPSWRHYLQHVEGLIYVVDSQDRERFSETKEAIQNIMEDPFLRNCIILVFANKQDVKGAMTPIEVCEGLGLCDLKDRKWHVKGTCAPTGEGIFEGLGWLSSTLKVLKANDDS